MFHSTIKVAALLLIAFVAANVQCVASCSIGMCSHGHASRPAGCHRQSHGNPPANGGSQTQTCAPQQPFFAKNSAESFPHPDARVIGIVNPASHAFPDLPAVLSLTAAAASPPLPAGPSSVLVLRV